MRHLTLLGILLLAGCLHSAPLTTPEPSINARNLLVFVISADDGLPVSARIIITDRTQQVVLHGWSVSAMIDGTVKVRVEAKGYAPQQRFTLGGMQKFVMRRVVAAD